MNFFRQKEADTRKNSNLQQTWSNSGKTNLMGLVFSFWFSVLLWWCISDLPQCWGKYLSSISLKEKGLYTYTYTPQSVMAAGGWGSCSWCSHSWKQKEEHCCSPGFLLLIQSWATTHGLRQPMFRGVFPLPVNLEYPQDTPMSVLPWRLYKSR